MGKDFIFHSNLSFKTSLFNQFPTFYANIPQSWKRNFSHISYTLNCIGSQFLWFNNYIKLVTILFSVKNIRVLKLTLPISYLHLREKLETEITFKENFNSPITYITKFHTQFLKPGNK